MGNKSRNSINDGKKKIGERDTGLFTLNEQKSLIRERQRRGLYENRWNVHKMQWEQQKVDTKELEYYEKVKNATEEETIRESAIEFDRDFAKYAKWRRLKKLEEPKRYNYSNYEYDFIKSLQEKETETRRILNEPKRNP